MSRCGNDSRYAVMMNMVWAVLTLGVNYAMNFLLTPYITNNMGVEAYNYISLANTFTGYVDIAAVGLNAFAGRFISIAYHKKDWEKANVYFTSTIAADAVLSGIILIPCCTGIFWLRRLFVIPAGLETDVKILFLLILVKYLLTVMRTAFDTAVFIANRLDIGERQQSIAYLLQAGFLLLLCLLLQPHVFYVGAAASLAAFYLLAVNIRLCRKLTPELRYTAGKCSWKAVKEMLSAGIWNSLNNLGDVLNSGLDLLITNLMLNATVSGEISIAKNLATVCYTVIGKISHSFRPSQLRLFARGDKQKMVELYKTTMKITGTFCNLMICTFYVCGYDFLSLWIPNQDIGFIYRASMIVLLGDIVVGVVNPLYYVFTLTKKLRLPCMITIGMGCANVISMYLLIKMTSLGAYAVLFTTLVINAVHFVDTPVYAAYCLNIRLTTFYPVILRHLAVGAAGMTAAWFLNRVLPEADTWLELFAKGACVAAVLFAVLAKLMFSWAELRKMLPGRYGET